MARSSDSGTESKTPLVVALVFFILTTLILGVTTYLFYGGETKAKEDAATAQKDKSAAQSERDKEQARTLFYKVLLGTNTPDEKTQFEGSRFKDDITQEYTRAMEAMANRVKTSFTAAMQDTGLRGDYRLDLKNFFEWNLSDGGNLSSPARPIIDTTVFALAQRQLLENNLKTNSKSLDDLRATTKQALDAYNQATQKYTQETAAIPDKISKEIQKYEAMSAAEKKKYADDLKQMREQRQNDSNALNEAQFKLDREKATVKNLQTQNDKLVATQEATQDPFQFDKPSGKILRRLLNSNQVEINLGSADYLKPGIKFSVQPSDTAERGLGSRLRQVRNQDNKLEYRIQAKANIEVIEILGDHLSVARITDEFDSVRDRVMAGDLLYNSAWRKGAADHICLFGIFDLDADGVDDIQLVVNNLNKSGIVVDAYFDLATMKWNGQITERTIYAIEGYVPVIKGLDGNADYKARITTAMDEAKKYAKERGAKIVKIRDFFPRIGYDVNLAITDDRINQAASKYFQSVAKEGEAAPANGTKN